MRSHVMKGKNAGKTIHRRSRLELGGRVPCDKANYPNEAERRKSEELGLVLRNRGNVLRFFQFPVELSEQSLKTIDQCKWQSSDE